VLCRRSNLEPPSRRKHGEPLSVLPVPNADKFPQLANLHPGVLRANMGDCCSCACGRTCIGMASPTMILGDTLAVRGTSASGASLGPALRCPFPGRFMVTLCS
jgi:hypothetical protein